MTTTFRVTVDSPYEGVNTPHFEGTVSTPSALFEHEVGTAYPTAQQIATHFAAEYCDSGSVIVEGNGERGKVLRRCLAG